MFDNNVAELTSPEQLFRLQGALADVAIKGLTDVNKAVVQKGIEGMGDIGEEYARKIRMLGQSHGPGPNGNIIDDIRPIRIPPGMYAEFHRPWGAITAENITFVPVDQAWCRAFAKLTFGNYDNAKIWKYITDIGAVNSVALDYFLDFPDTLPNEEASKNGMVFFIGTLFHDCRYPAVRMLVNGKGDLLSSKPPFKEEMWLRWTDELIKPDFDGMKHYIACLKR